MLRTVALILVWIVHLIESATGDLAGKMAELQSGVSDTAASNTLVGDVLGLLFSGLQGMFSTTPNIYLTCALLIITFGIPLRGNNSDEDARY